LSREKGSLGKKRDEIIKIETQKIGKIHVRVLGIIIE